MLFLKFKPIVILSNVILPIFQLCVLVLISYIRQAKSRIGKIDYIVDKLECRVNKDSENFGIPMSKANTTKHIKIEANMYNHRQKFIFKTRG
jgi:hypothetical protein